ncbi:MAG: glycosyltransferase family 87 protein, partial [Candidatus Thorarchaeota archaeon]
MSMNNNDFLSFYRAGIIVLDDLPNLYNSSLYLFPFRYLPLSAFFFTPFSLMGLELGYFVFQIVNFILNILNLYLIYRIIRIYHTDQNESELSLNNNNFKDIFIKSENESILRQNAIYLIMLPQFMNYFLGQINIIVLLFTLSSFYFFLKKKNVFDFLGGLMLGCGILLKPTLILL